MIRMIKFLMIGVFLLTANSAFAYSFGVNVGDELDLLNHNSATMAGEMTIKDVNTGTVWTTFCLERLENLNYADKFTVQSISDSAHSVPADPISDETAYLFAYYTSGSLTGYDGSVDAQVALQYAIWGLEDEDISDIGNLTVAQKTLYDSFLDDASKNSLGAASTGYVQVVTIWNETKNKRAQDVLITPVPEPATMALLGIGLLGIAGISRKRRS